MEIYKQITANNIQLKEYPFLKELAMEAYLMENGDILNLDREDFSSVEILDAEIALKSGRKTSNRDGRIDILAKYGVDYLSIVELKTNEINEATLSQLEDYLSERDQILEKYPDYWDEGFEPKWIGVLVGSSISPELQRMLLDGYKTESGLPIAGLVLRRYRAANTDVYVVSDTYFNYKYSKRDHSKFEFRNVEYNKSRLVNAVIRTYVAETRTVDFAELEKAFPQSLQTGKTGVFTTKGKAKDIFEKTGHKRYYINPDEFIALSDSIIATTNQWGISNIMNFVNHVNDQITNFEITLK